MTNKETNGEIVIPTFCASHCGGSCLLKAHVKDGVITRIDTDDGEEPQLRGCVRGRAYRQRVYAPDRLLYPMKRVGERGEGKFKRISWDEALDTVAVELKRVRDTYGPISILCLNMAGDISEMNVGIMSRVLSKAGGYTATWGAASFHGGVIASFFSYGSIFASNTRDDLVNSNLIIMWGWDPSTSISGSNTAWFVAQARERGAKVISINPWFDDTAATLAHEWIPIRPGTDTAMAIAMAYVMIKDNLQDQKFLDTYTVGFDKFKDYVLGKEDGVPKTPAWAEAITEVPASVIERLAREYATAKPAALMSGTGAGRTAYGEQFHRATIALAAMTGNVGVHGGDAGARAWESCVGGYPYKTGMASRALPWSFNPVESPPEFMFLYGLHYTYPNVHFVKVADAILKGKEGGYPADYKLIVGDNVNYLNSMPNVNKIVKALKAVEFIVVWEQFMTAFARYADIILPTTTFMERDDMAGGVGLPLRGMQNKAIEPLGECKTQLQIAKELAARMDITDLDDMTVEEHLKELARFDGIPDLQALRQSGVYRIKLPEPHVAFRKEIEDPGNNPFPTPSGKIEIYCQKIADMDMPDFPPIPKYIETWESLNDPLAKKYPIQLLTNHHKTRANAQYDNLPWLRELMPQRITINAGDAQARGIKNGEVVRVFNDRGEVRIPAQVTQRIMPGVAILPHGAWYDPDSEGIDKGGCANVLTKDEHSPVGSFAYNTALVQVEKV